MFIVSAKEKLTGSKLPSKGEVLSNFLHYHQDEKLTIGSSADAVVNKVTEFWEKARIPIIRKDHSIAKLQKLYVKYQQLKKGRKRRSPCQIQKEETFGKSLRDLFDIASADALSTIDNKEDRDFLIAQREPGRRGTLGSIDISLAIKEKKAVKRKKVEEERKLRSDQAASTAFKTAKLESSSTGSSSDEMCSEFEDMLATAGPSEKEKDSEDNAEVHTGASDCKRATMNIMTPSLAAALDRAKVSDRKATSLLVEASKAFKQNVKNLNINRSSIRRQRRLERRNLTLKLKAEFSSDMPLSVHWDGKLMQDLISHKHVDRLPILVSGNGVSQLLRVEKIPNGTGREQSNAVVNALEDWNLSDKVVSMVFDTTASNTGRLNGACTHIEKMLEKNLLYFACRHHVMELVAKAAFTTLFKSTRGPDEVLFKRFQAKWETIDKDKFQSGADHEDVALIIGNYKSDLILWAEKSMKEMKDLRDDYRELLELSLIFLGGTPPRGVHFNRPGAMHHARWMSKEIYSLKIWMFRGQFKLTYKEEQSLRKMSVFVSTVFVKHWIESSISISAPRNDLELLKALHDYSETDKEISKATLEKFSSHLWYLSEELVAMSLFDALVPSTTKILIVKAMNEKSAIDETSKKAKIRLETIKNYGLEDFATERTMSFFSKMNLPTGYLSEHPDLWSTRDDYKRAKDIIQGIKVTNDNAERGVALIQEYNRFLTKDEEQLQFLLQVVSEHRKQFPDSRKSTLLKQQ